MTRSPLGLDPGLAKVAEDWNPGPGGADEGAGLVNEDRCRVRDRFWVEDGLSGARGSTQLVIFDGLQAGILVA